MPQLRRSKFKWPVLAGLLGKVFLPGCAPAHEQDLKRQHFFDDVRWEHRLLVFTGPQDAVNQQAKACRSSRDEMLERELIVVDASGDPGKLVVGVQEDIPDASIFRNRFDMNSEVFQVVLVGKDGGIKERRTEKFEIEELFAIIDAMPMRIREMHERE